MKKKSKTTAIETNVVEIPGAGDYRRAFVASSMRHNFHLTLTGPMLEMLCAIADGVVRDREYHFTFSSVTPGDFVSRAEPLIKRGLVYHVPRHLQPVEPPEAFCQQNAEGRQNYYKLTPIGEALVELLKLAGLFVKADAALDRETRSR